MLHYIDHATIHLLSCQINFASGINRVDSDNALKRIRLFPVTFDKKACVGQSEVFFRHSVLLLSFSI